MATQSSYIAESIESELERLRIHIREYTILLREEGVWLFIATLGCWSVNWWVLQLPAIALTFGLFLHRFFGKLTNRKTFRTLIEGLKSRIEAEAVNDQARKAHLYDLIQVQQVDLVEAQSLRQSWVFWACWFFCCASLIYFIGNFISHISGEA